MNKLLFVNLITILPLLIVTGCSNKDNPSSSEHVHTYSQYWAYNNVEHWHEATCGHSLKSDTSLHNYGDWYVTIAPTYDSKGEETRLCKTCHYLETREVGKLTPTDPDPEVKDIFGEKKLSCDWAFGEYNINTALSPIWDSKTIYHETLTFADKNDTPGLLYNPSEIISVYDYALQKEFIEGEDFTVEGNKLKLTANTTIPYWGSINPSETLYMDTPGSITIQSKKYYEMVPSQIKYIFYSESIPNYYQLKVTYKTNDSWNGFVPTSYEDKFEKTISKLESKQLVNIALLGDSISFGRGSSSDLNSYFERNTPCYANLFYEYLQNRYPNAPIVFDNQAVGGTTASWGATTGLSRLNVVPDLLLVAFGMNDDGGSASSYASNIANIITKAREINPEVEILLISPMLDNVDRLGHDCHLYSFEQELIKLISTNENVGVATVTSLTKYIYENTDVKFEDLNSNHYNHPNDFVHRLYAQTILKALLGTNYISLI